MRPFLRDFIPSTTARVGKTEPSTLILIIRENSSGSREENSPAIEVPAVMVL
jgi:hypothetical protein